MNIVINSLHINPQATGGGETYVRELVRSLAAVDHKNTYTLLVWFKAESSLKDLRASNIRLQGVRRTPFHRMIRATLRRFAAPHATGWLANIDADIMHWPNSVIMLRPFALATPSVLTMMDIQHEYFPEFFSQQDLHLRQWLYPESVKRADAIITISKTTRDTLIERYNTAPEKITVIYPGVNRDRFSSIPSEEQRRKVGQRYNLPERFLIYPAGTWPHKNHIRLLQALKQCTDVACIFTGIQQSAHHEVMMAIQDLQLDKRVLHIGHVGWNELPTLYHMAEGMIFPSLFEGFGLPVLEAMAAGCPVAASNQSTIVEVSRGAAHLFDPYDVDEIADAIRRLWDDSQLKQDLSMHGNMTANQYDWQITARETINIYRRVAEERSL